MLLKKKLLFSILLSILWVAGCATQNQHLLEVVTTPSNALVSVHDSGDASPAGIRKIAGTTPVEKTFDFGKSGQIRLEIEKRGYAPHTETISSDTGTISIDLERIRNQNGEWVKEYAFPAVNRILLAPPRVEIIERGFSSEEKSEEKSSLACEEVKKGIGRYFSGRYEVINPETTSADRKLLRSIWREVRSAVEMLDPIRLRYLAEPVFLETKSGIMAARRLGQRYDAEVILFVSGKQNVETAGMLAGKIGGSVLGTATSFAGGYSRAVANGDSFFVYNVYIPQFAEGTLLKAALIDCDSGEILWLNKGLWGQFAFAEADSLKTVMADLLAGIDRLY
jgi:PBP1b-binding outer membrane lipoprotein LpoB